MINYIYIKLTYPLYLYKNILIITFFFVSFVYDLKADPSVATSLYHKGNFDLAKEICDKELYKKNPTCLNLLGIIIIRENHIEKFKIARPYFEKAWSKGYRKAARNLAWMYALGLGVDQDLDKSSFLYKKAEVIVRDEKDLEIDISINNNENVISMTKENVLESQLRSSYASFLKIKKISEITDPITNENKYVQLSELKQVADSIKFITEISKKNGLAIESIIKEVTKDQELILMLITSDFGSNDVNFRGDVVANLKLIEEIKSQINK